MKPRPPTMRDNFRYLLVSVRPSYSEIEPRKMYYALLDVITSVWGDAGAAEIKMAVISCEKGYVVLRCLRGTEAMLETAIAALASVDDKRLALHSVATSGTLRSLRRRIRTPPEVSEGGECTIREKTYIVYTHSRQKVDLLQRGIKNQDLLYFTYDDMENL